jgi:hypothetical protein
MNRLQLRHAVVAGLFVNALTRTDGLLMVGNTGLWQLLPSSPWTL